MSTTTDKMLAIESVINTWLKDPTKKCNGCGSVFFSNKITGGKSCCISPEIGSNRQIFEAFVLQNKDRRETRNDDLAQTKSKGMRWGVSLPPDLMFVLERYFKNYNEKLFSNKADLHKFMKKFKQFTIPQRV